MYYSKGLLSLAMMIAIGTMSSVMSHAAPMRAGQPMVEELAHVMDVAAEQELTYEEMASNSPCINKRGWSGDLTLKKLNEMMKTFLGATRGTTYIFVPQCPRLDTQGRVYVSEDGRRAEDNMAAHCGLPTEFYLTSAPSPDCAMKLYNEYSTKKYKPVIHIGLPYQGKMKESKDSTETVNLHCLAMLVESGFKILPWSWIDFKHDYITSDDCKEAVRKITSDSDSYDVRYSKALTAIRRAMDMMTGNHDRNYKVCKDATNGVNNERYAANNERYVAANNARYAVNYETYDANNERYTANEERYSANNEGYPANEERYAAANNERYIAATNERYPANQERYAANNERYPANQERYAANNERYPANQERYAANNERYPANQERHAANNGRYIADEERYTANEERYAANEEMYAANNERYPANEEMYAANNEGYPANEERYVAASNERYAANNDRYPWPASSERYLANEERYAANNERYPANEERYAANNERYPANEERYIAANNARYAANEERYAAKFINEMHAANNGRHAANSARYAARNE